MMTKVPKWTERQLDAARRHTTMAHRCECVPDHEVDARDWRTIQTILNRIVREAGK